MVLSEMLESEADPESPSQERGRSWRNRLRSRPKRPRQPRPPLPEPPPRKVEPKPLVQAIGAGVMLLGVVVLGMYVYLYGLSGLSEQRSQSELYKTFAEQLAEATAPTGAPAVSEGAPVAILDIPALGINDMVVVEGATANDLTHGPG